MRTAISYTNISCLIIEILHFLLSCFEYRDKNISVSFIVPVKYIPISNLNSSEGLRLRIFKIDIISLTADTRNNNWTCLIICCTSIWCVLGSIYSLNYWEPLMKLCLNNLSSATHCDGVGNNWIIFHSYKVLLGSAHQGPYIIFATRLLIPGCSIGSEIFVLTSWRSSRPSSGSSISEQLQVTVIKRLILSQSTYIILHIPVIEIRWKFHKQLYLASISVAVLI